MKNELLKLKKELSNINKDIKEIMDNQDELMRYEAVRKYVRLDLEKEILSKEKAKFNEEYTVLLQENCNDPLWYFLDSSKDDHTGKESWTCVCFECKKLVTDAPKKFKQYVRVENPSYYENEQGDLSFRNLLGKYYKYKHEKPNANVTSKTMIKKYNGKK